MLRTIVGYVKNFFRTNKDLDKFNEQKLGEQELKEQQLEEQKLEEEKVTHGEKVEATSMNIPHRQGEEIINLGDMYWNKMTSKLSGENIEVQTLKHGLWFHAYYENDCIYVEKAKNNEPSCCITAKRKITEDKFKMVFPYFKEKNTLRKEAVKISQNTAYIYALINHFEKIED